MRANRYFSLAALGPDGLDRIALVTAEEAVLDRLQAGGLRPLPGADPVGCGWVVVDQRFGREMDTVLYAPFNPNRPLLDALERAGK